MTAEAYPLHWPQGWPRAESQTPARFDTSMAVARDCLFDELNRMGAEHIVLSTNIELRLDGLPYANRRQPNDVGAAIYFYRKGKAQAFACDRWSTVKDNIQALRKTIEALRGIDRWGASHALDRAYSAFEALPDQSARAWYSVLGIPEDAGPELVMAAYKMKRGLVHPDKGGSAEQFHAVQAAYDQWRSIQ